MFEQEILKLYPGYDKVYGPYVVTNGRRCIILVNRCTKKRRTMSYARALVEVKLGHVLPKELEADHIDEDPSNDTPDNIQPLSPEQNRAKAAAAGKMKLGWQALIDKIGEKEAIQLSKSRLTKKVCKAGGKANKGIPKSDEHRLKISKSIKEWHAKRKAGVAKR